MKESNFADICYSKELKDLFPNAEWWWYKITNKWNVYNWKNGTPDTALPALTTEMLLEILPIGTKLIKLKDCYSVWIMDQIPDKFNKITMYLILYYI